MRACWGRARLAAAAHVQNVRDRQEKIDLKRKTLTCPAVVLGQRRQVQTRDVVARLRSAESLLDLHGRRLTQKRTRDKHQLHRSGGCALLKLSNTLPAPAPVYLQAGRRQGAGPRDKPLRADWLPALPHYFEVGVVCCAFFLSVPLPFFFHFLCALLRLSAAVCLGS